MNINSKHNNNFYLKKKFYFFIVDNQNIFNIKGEIKPRFFLNYNKSFFVDSIF